MVVQLVDSSKEEDPEEYVSKEIEMVPKVIHRRADEKLEVVREEIYDFLDKMATRQP